MSSFNFLTSDLATNQQMHNMCDTFAFFDLRRKDPRGPLPDCAIWRDSNNVEAPFYRWDTMNGYNEPGNCPASNPEDCVGFQKAGARTPTYWHDRPCSLSRACML